MSLDDPQRSEVPADWRKTPPDYFYFSRAAFNPEKTRAIVFVIVFDHKAAASGGYYLLLKKTPKGWRTDYNSQAWSLKADARLAR